jgi:guanosine-3',5'-bis(diphosphate) 3'-pyrophosphohydrolase
MTELADIQAIFRALSFAADKHRRQRRKDREASPYINHPIDLAQVLATEGDIAEVETICAALLHDVLEDTETGREELEEAFGPVIRGIVEEVSDDKTLPKETRKRLQIEHAAHASRSARLVKLADKICNLRDILQAPPADWSLERKREYVRWAGAVIDRLRGTHEGLERAFDAIYERGRAEFGAAAKEK